MIDPLSPSANQPLGHHQPLGARALGVLDLAYFFPDGLPDVESLAEEATPTAEHPLINRTATSENSPPENTLSTSDHPLASINSPVQNVPSALAATSESSRIQREDSPEPEHFEPRNILPASEPHWADRSSEPENIPLISISTSENIPIQKQSSSESVLPPLTSPKDTSLEDPLYAQSNTEAQSTPGTKNHALPGHDLLPVVIDFSTPPAPLQPQRATEGTLSSPTEPGLDMVPDSNPVYSAPLQPNQVPENHNSFPTESSPENLESSIDSKIENHPDALNRTDSPKPLSQPDQVSPEIIQRFSENPIAALPIAETPSEQLDIETSVTSFNADAISMPIVDSLEPSSIESPLTPNPNQENSIANPENRRSEVSLSMDAGNKQAEFGIIFGDAGPQSIQKDSADNSDPLSNDLSISTTNLPGIEKPSISREAETQNLQKFSDAASILPWKATSISPTDFLSSEDSLIANGEKISSEVIQKSNEHNFDTLIETVSASMVSLPSSEDSPGTDSLFIHATSESRPEFATDVISTPTVESFASRNLARSETPSSEIIQNTQANFVASSLDTLSKSDSDSSSSEVAPKTFEPSNSVPSDEFIPAPSTDLLSPDNLSVPRTLAPKGIQKLDEPSLSLPSDSKPETIEASFSSETLSGHDETLLDGLQLSSDSYLSLKDDEILSDDIQSSNDSSSELRAESIFSPIEDFLTIGSLKTSEGVQPDIVQKSGRDDKPFLSDTISESTSDLGSNQAVTNVESLLTENIQKSGTNKFAPIESIVSESTPESLNNDILTRVEASSPGSVHGGSVQKVHESHLTFPSPTASEFTSDPIGSETQSKTQPRAEELVHEHIQRSMGHDLTSAPDTISGSLADATRTEITPIVQSTASNPTSTSSKEILSPEILPRSEEETPEGIQNSSDSSPTSSTYSTSLSEELSPTVEVSPTSEALQKAGSTLPESIQTSSEGNSPFLTDSISVPITVPLNPETLLRAEISSSNVFREHGENSPNISADSTSTSVGNDPIPKVLSSSDELMTGNIQRSSETHITDPKDPRPTEDLQQSETLPSIRNLVSDNLQKSSEHSDNYLADDIVKLPEASQIPENLVMTEAISSSRHQEAEGKGADFLADSSSESTASPLDSELSSGTSNVLPESVQRFDATNPAGSLNPGLQIITGEALSEPVQRSSHDSPSFPVESLSATSLSAAKADILNPEALADAREILPENTQTSDEVNYEASPSYEVLSRAEERLPGSEQELPEPIQRANERSSASLANELSEPTADSLSPDHLCQSDGAYSELGGLTAQAEDPPTVVSAQSDGALSDSLLVNDPEAESHAVRPIDIAALGEQSVDPQLLNRNSVQREIDQRPICLTQAGPHQMDSLGNLLWHQGQGDYEKLPVVIDFQASPKPLQRKPEIGTVSGHSRDGLEPSIQLPSQAEGLPKEKVVDLLQSQDELGDFSLTSQLPQDGHARDNFSQLSPTSNHGSQQPLPRDESNNAGNASLSLPITLSRVDDVQIQHPQEPETFSPQFANDVSIQRTEAPRAEASQSSEVSELGKVVLQSPEEAMSDTSQLLGLIRSQSPRSPHPKSLSPRERDFEASFRLPSPRGRGVGGEGGIVAKEHVCELLRLDEVSTSHTEKPGPESYPPSAIDAVPIQQTETTTSYFSKPTDANIAQVQLSEQPVPDWVKDPKIESGLIQRSDANDLSELPTEWQSLADLVAFQTQSSSPSTALPNAPQPEADAPAEAMTGFLKPPITSLTAPPMESLTEHPKAPQIAPPGGLSTTPIPPIQRKLTVSRNKPVMKARNQPSIQAQHSGEASPSMPSFLIQAKEDTPFTTIEANQSRGDNHRSEQAYALEQLAQEIYQRMRQRLVIEKERHGRLYPKRLR